MFTNNGGTVNGGFGGNTQFSDTSNAGSGTFVNNGGQVSGAQNGETGFFNSSSASNGTFINNGSTVSGALGGVTRISQTASAGSATLIANGSTGGGVGGGIRFLVDSTGGTSRVEVFGDGFLAIDQHNAPGVTIGSLEGTGAVLLGGNTLTVGSNNLTTTFSGSATGSGGLTKIGTGTLTLSGLSNYTGATTVNNGTLTIDNNNTTIQRLPLTSSIAVNSGGTLLLAQSGSASTDRINNNAGVTLAGGGTFQTGGLSEGIRPTNSGASNGVAGLGALTLQSTTSLLHATIDFGSGANGSSLVFSSLVGGNGAFLDIKNWTGTPFTDNSATGNDRLLFGIDPGLTAAQLANVRFFDDSGAFIGAGEIIGYGNMFELVAVPEPSTWLAAALALGAIGFSQRKRLRARTSFAVKKHF